MSSASSALSAARNGDVVAQKVLKKAQEEFPETGDLLLQFNELVDGGMAEQEAAYRVLFRAQKTAHPEMSDSAAHTAMYMSIVRDIIEPIKYLIEPDTAFIMDAAPFIVAAIRNPEWAEYWMTTMNTFLHEPDKDGNTSECTHGSDGLCTVLTQVADELVAKLPVNFT